MDIRIEKMIGDVLRIEDPAVIAKVAALIRDTTRRDLENYSRKQIALAAFDALRLLEELEPETCAA